MVELTPELLGSSFIVTFGFLFVSIGFQIYMLYLNWKQSKVKNTQEEQIELLKDIRDLLKKGK